MNIKNHLKYLQSLSKLIGGKIGLPSFFLVLGGTLMGFLELVGIMAIFPLMNFIHSPHMMESNGYLNKIKTLLDIESSTVITLFGVMIIGIFATKNLFQILYLKYEFKVLAKWRVQLSEKFFRASIYTDYDILITRSSADNIATITGVISEAISNYFFQFIQLINVSVTAIILLSFLLIAYTEVTVIILLLGFCLIYSHNVFLKNKLRNIGMRTRKLSVENFSVLQQSFKGIKETKVNLKENFFISKFQTVNQALIKEDEKRLFLQNIPSSTIEFVMMTLIILVFIYFTTVENSAALIFAKLGTLTIISIRMVPLINRCIQSLLLISAAEEPVEKLLKEAKRLKVYQCNTQATSKYTTPLPPCPFNHSLNIQNIKYRYPNSHLYAINNISLSITKGQFIGIVGPSGGGKTTLADILSGFLHPESGSFTIDNNLITKNNIRSLRQLIGYVGQQVFLLDSTIEQNIAYGEQLENICSDRVVETLKKSMLWDFVKTLKKGIKTPIGEDGAILSGGQKQRLLIARALYAKAQILILDEASSTLDVETEHNFFQYLYSLKGDLTVIIIAHRLATLKGCDVLYYIENGRVIDFGSKEQLQRKNESFARYIKYSALEEST